MWGVSYHAPSNKHQMLLMWYSVVVVSIIQVMTEYIEPENHFLASELEGQSCRSEKTHFPLEVAQKLFSLKLAYSLIR